jgi:nitroreductase
MSYDEFLNLVKNRRTVRRFKSDPIPDEYVDKIIEAARWAPSGLNQQPWEFVVVKKPELKAAIAALGREQLQIASRMEVARESWQGAFAPPPQASDAGGDFSVAPVYILMFGDPRTNQGLPMSVRCDAALLRSTLTSSLACAFVYMQLAATELGLASQWFTSLEDSYASCMIKNLLGIPLGLEFYDMLVVGHPAAEARPKLLRDKARMIHQDYCGPQVFRTDEEVRDYVRTFRQGMTNSETQSSLLDT